MAVGSKPKAKATLTRREREAASAAAAAEFDAIDWAPIGRGTLVVFIVLVLLLAAWMFVPGGAKFGGPLQDSNVAAGSTMSTVRRAKGMVSVGAFVPWNTSGSPVMLEQIVPIGADGVEVVKTGLAAPGQVSIVPQRGYPPDGVILFPVEGSTIDPGSGPLDGAQIAVGLRGEGSVLGFVLVYRAGGQQHRALLPNGVVMCRRACGDTTAVVERQRGLLAELSMYVDAPSR
jgi:hypothetical protein